MGMFGCLMTSWASGWELYLSTPQRFTFAPRSWFSDLANYRGTITGGTSTALHLGARAHAGRAARISGELMTRCFVVGAERVEQSTLQYAAEVFGPYGFRAESFMPSYGLAEATLAATATPVTEAPRHLVVDAIALADGELREVVEGSEFATAVVSSGVPCKGVELVGASSGGLTEICVRTPSLAAGYFCDEQRTNERFVDNSVRTADIGFVRDGYLYPVGRLDDVISVAGRKVYAREIENAVDAVDGVRRGCSTLIGGDGGRALTLFVEVKNGLKDYRSLAEEFASVAMSKAAVALDECVFLGRNSLPKTPSGKIQRHRCRQLFDAGRFKPLATVHLGAMA
jgi:fatty-acyl-CoA synthase